MQLEFFINFFEFFIFGELLGDLLKTQICFFCFVLFYYDLVQYKNYNLTVYDLEIF